MGETCAKQSCFDKQSSAPDFKMLPSKSFFPQIMDFLDVVIFLNKSVFKRTQFATHRLADTLKKDKGEKRMLKECLQ